LTSTNVTATVILSCKEIAQLSVCEDSLFWWCSCFLAPCLCQLPFLNLVSQEISQDIRYLISLLLGMYRIPAVQDYPARFEITCKIRKSVIRLKWYLTNDRSNLSWMCLTQSLLMKLVWEVYILKCAQWIMVWLFAVVCLYKYIYIYRPIFHSPRCPSSNHLSLH